MKVNKLLRGGSRLSKLFKLGGGGQEAGPPPPAEPPPSQLPPPQDTINPRSSSPQPLTEAATDSSLGSQYSLDSLDERKTNKTPEVPPSPATFLKRVASIRTINPMDGSLYSCAGEELSDNIFGEREPVPRYADDQFSLFESDVLPEEEVHVVQQPDKDTEPKNKPRTDPILRHEEAAMTCQVAQSAQVSVNCKVPEANIVVDAGREGTTKQFAIVAPCQLVDDDGGRLTGKIETEHKTTTDPKASPVQVRTQTVEQNSLVGEDSTGHESTELTVPVNDEKADREVVVPAASMAEAQLPVATTASNISLQMNNNPIIVSSESSNQPVVIPSEASESAEEDYQSKTLPATLNVDDDTVETIIDVADSPFTDHNHQGEPSHGEMSDKRKKNRRGNRRGKNHTKNRDRSDHGKPNPADSVTNKPIHENEQTKVIPDEKVVTPDPDSPSDELLPESIQQAALQMCPQLPLDAAIVNNVIDNTVSADPTVLTASESATNSESTSLSSAMSKQTELTSLPIETQPEHSDPSSVPLTAQDVTNNSSGNDTHPSTLDTAAVQVNSEIQQQFTDTPKQIKPVTPEICTVNLVNINNGTNENDGIGSVTIPSTATKDTCHGDSLITATERGVASMNEDGPPASVGIPLEGFQIDSSYLQSLANHAERLDQVHVSGFADISIAPCDSGKVDDTGSVQNKCEPKTDFDCKEILHDKPDLSTTENVPTNVADHQTLPVDKSNTVNIDIENRFEQDGRNVIGTETSEDAVRIHFACPSDGNNEPIKTEKKLSEEASTESCNQIDASGDHQIIIHSSTDGAIDNTLTDTKAMCLEEVKPKNNQHVVATVTNEDSTVIVNQNCPANEGSDTLDAVEQHNENKTPETKSSEIKSRRKTAISDQRPSKMKMPSIKPPVASDTPEVSTSLDPMEEFNRLEKAIQEAEKARNTKSCLEKPPKIQREGSASPLPSRRQIGKPKLMDQRENSAGKIERPSKMLREHSMSPVHFRRVKTPADSLNTTAESISPDNSLAQDITYDIVDQERIRPSKNKKFTFGLEIPVSEPPEMVSSTVEAGRIAPGMVLGSSYIVEKNVSEESLPLASELENVEDHLQCPTAQLSVSVLTSSNPQETVKPLLVDLSELVGTSIPSGQSSVNCMESELISFAYLADDRTVVAIDKALEEQTRGACRVTISYRVEPMDLVPSDTHSSYLRSPRLENSPQAAASAGSHVQSTSGVSGRHGQKPSAIVSPMKPAMVSRSSQTEVLHGDASDGFRLLTARPSSNIVDDLRRALATYSEVVAVLKKRLDDCSKNNSRSTEALAKELLTEKARNHKLEQTVNNLERTVQSTMSRMGEVRGANSELREVVQSQLDMLTEYKSQIEDLTFEKDVLTAGKREVEEATEEKLRREKHTLDKQAALLRAQMEMKNMEIERLQQEARIMREQLSSCQKVINDLQQY